MRILMIGGTGFIGAHVLRHLLDGGHEVMVFHRGQTEIPLPSTIQQLYGDRRELPSFAAEFHKFSPQVALDVIPYSEHDAIMLRQTMRGITGRLVALSSQDVYHAYGVFIRLEEGALEPVPYDEDAPLRTHLYPYRDQAPGPDDLKYNYEKILVEKAMMSAMDNMELPWTILRLPQVYGPGDGHHRLFEYLKLMDGGRGAILLGEQQSEWRWTRGYVEEVAAAIVLAVTDERAAGRIYNVGEPEALSEKEWARTVGDAAGWDGEVVSVPEVKLPDYPYMPSMPDYNWRQSLAAKTSRIRTELGYHEMISRVEALRRTVEWERANPPEF
ncbi:MAG: NAD-dependent epimerase/dehydratase family protein [Blastocatellia bacterium]|nr:NAD-dependent epimerase/dehydratase family protein [Blastocatellia bacterium]